MLCQREEREAGRAYPRTCPTCRLGPCQKFGAKPLQSLSDAQAEIARLTAEATFLKGLMDQRTVTIRNLEAERDQALARAEKAEIDAEFFKSEVKLRNRIESTNNTAASLQRKYEEALAQAATAATEMRERAAEAYEDGFPEWDTFSAAATAIRALPIDPDAQKALDQLLAKARKDAIREAARVASEANPGLAGRFEARINSAILALLNDGEDDGKTT